MAIKKYLSRQNGVTLLEVLVSTLILGLAMLSLAPLMVLSVKSNGNSRDRSVAMQLAKEKLESLETSDELDLLPPTEEEINLNEKFTRTTIVADHAIDSLIPEDRYKVTVIVSWVSVDQYANSTKLSTLI